MIQFSPSDKGIYHHKIDNHREAAWSFESMVTGQSDKYTNWAIDKAKTAECLQNIIMWPGMRQLIDIAIHHSKGCPITQADIHVAKDIYGPNLGSLKGKTVDRPNPHVSTGVDPVPHEILKLHKSITICIDIMFINKILSS